jgi:hypothetical protein
MTTYDQTRTQIRYKAALSEPVSVRSATAVIAGASLGIWALIGWALSVLL